MEAPVIYTQAPVSRTRANTHGYRASANNLSTYLGVQMYIYVPMYIYAPSTCPHLPHKHTHTHQDVEVLGEIHRDPRELPLVKVQRIGLSREEQRPQKINTSLQPRIYLYSQDQKSDPRRNQLAKGERADV